MKDKKVKVAIISVVALLLVLIGVTYAYWLVTKTQTNSNIISSACLDITLDNESNDISLSSQYPLSKEEGMALTPYTFKVTNNCNTSIDYQVVLESIGDEANAIKASALQVALDTKVDLLSNRAPVTTTVSGAYAAHRLGYGTLAASGNEGSSATHSLRIWIDENAPISEANKTFQSKISVTIGQGIKNPYVEGTMAYDILANNDEATVLSATWVNKEPAAETYNSVSKTSNYWYGTSYIIDERGVYQLSGDLVQATLEECRNGTKSCGEYTLENSKQDYQVRTLYKITSFTSDEKADTTSTLYMTTQSITAKNDFTIANADGEGGLYKTIDDLGESYYFRGDVTNNYVQFGSYAANSKINVMDPDSWDNTEVTFTEATPMYWRIVRVNGDGTIRLVYDGTEKVANGTAHRATIGTTTYNGDDYLNVNYGDSDIKGIVDTWYNTHLKTNYETSIADGIFCNDKEVTQGTYYDADWEEITDPEVAEYKNEYYAPYTRIGTNKAPKLTCTRKEDRYTTNANLGNGQLTHPVGLLTADEVVFAGGLPENSNESFYLTTGDLFWTSSPYFSIEDDERALVWHVISNTLIFDEVNINGELGTRPVINLRADVEFTGDGSFETPYVIVT